MRPLRRQPVRFAFYGTLMEGEGRELDADLGTYGPQCAIYGQLLDVGGFPALVDGDGLVFGQLWRPHRGRADAALRLIDGIEGYMPDTANSMYVRQLRELVLPCGRKAWTYLWNGPRDLPVIRGGDWRAYRRLGART